MEIYSDDQYQIDSNLDVSRVEHASNLKEINWAFFNKYLISNNISKEEALRQFEILKDREAKLQEEMLTLINNL